MRGGFGIFYQTLGNGGCGCTDGVGGAPISASSDGINPALYWDNGIKPTSAPQRTRFDPNADNFYNGGVYRQGPNYGKAPRIYNWSFTIQHEVEEIPVRGRLRGQPRLRAELDGVHQPVEPAAICSLGSLLGKNITDPAVVAAGYKEPFAGFAKGWGGGGHAGTGTASVPAVRNGGGRQRRRRQDLVRLAADQGRAQVRRLPDDGILRLVEEPDADDLPADLQPGRAGADRATASTSRMPRPTRPWTFPHFLNILASYQLPFGSGKKFLGKCEPPRRICRWAAGPSRARSSTAACSLAPDLDPRQSQRLGRAVHPHHQGQLHGPADPHQPGRDGYGSEQSQQPLVQLRRELRRSSSAAGVHAGHDLHVQRAVPQPVLPQ